MKNPGQTWPGFFEYGSGRIGSADRRVGDPKGIATLP